MHALDLQQTPFVIKTGGKAPDSSICINDSMARNDDGHRVAAVRPAYGAEGFGRTDALGEFRIADDSAIGDAEQTVPDLLLERSALEVERQVELPEVTTEIRCELVSCFFEERIGVGTR